jgi:uncharacterized membrane protein YebE (DUF533 family)
MFNAQQMLGALLSDGVHRSSHARHHHHHHHQHEHHGDGGLLDGIPGGTVGKVLVGTAGIAAVGGLAYAAYSHFKQPGAPGAPAGGGLLGGLFGSPGPAAAPAGWGQGGPAPGGGPPPGGAWPAAAPGGWGQGTAPAGAPWGAPPGAGAPAPAMGAPPPIPSYQSDPSTWGAPLGGAAPVAQGAPSPEPQADALLLVRAMITAASIDGQIDPGERARILDGAAAGGLGPAERDALAREMEHPHPPFALLGQVRSREMAEQFYVVSIFAAATDSEVERAYLRGLPPILGFRPEEVAQIHQRLGVPVP